MLIQKMSLMRCLNSPYMWCFKAPFINKLSNIRHGQPYVTKFVNKGWNIVMTWDHMEVYVKKKLDHV